MCRCQCTLLASVSTNFVADCRYLSVFVGLRYRVTTIEPSVCLVVFVSRKLEIAPSCSTLVGELDVWVNRIQVGIGLFQELLMDAGVAIVDVPVSPFRWMRGGCECPLFDVLRN